MKFELYFSEEQMKDFLKKKKYIVKEVKTWKSHNVYHNGVEYEDVTTWIAYKEEPSKELLERDEHWISSRIGIELVFREELTKQLLNT